MRVVFTEIAEETHEGIIEFLSFQWTEREINIFLNDVEKVGNNLEEGNYMLFQKSRFKTRSALIGKITSECSFAKRMKI